MARLQKAAPLVEKVTTTQELPDDSLPLTTGKIQDAQPRLRHAQRSIARAIPQQPTDQEAKIPADLNQPLDSAFEKAQVPVGEQSARGPASQNSSLGDLGPSTFSDDDAALIAKTDGLAIASDVHSADRDNLVDSYTEDDLIQSPDVNSPTNSFRPSLIDDDQTDLASYTTPSVEKKSKVKGALEDVSHFAGGLIHHPTESTKHFTILRHSHGIVYYQGLTTSLAVTIFSDKPLPSDRRLWLQMKGWTGKVGMRAKALLRSNGSWIEVTPSTKAEAAQLLPADERAWQRDIQKFLKKASKHKQLKHHVVRQTSVLRIPHAAEDGYFQIVLTEGGQDKTPLCRSPVFRVASTSMSSSSIKGAGLSTLPIEVGIKIMQKTAVTVAGNAAAPMANTVRSQLQPHMPNFWMEEAGTLAYDTTVQDKISNANQAYDRALERSVDASDPAGPFDIFDRPDIVGEATGPSLPFPIRLDSKVAQGTGRSAAELQFPTANLSKPPDDFKLRLRGVYFGWACITPAGKDDEIAPDWHQAIVSSALCQYSNPTIAPREVVKAFLIHDFAGVQFVGAQISLLVMGFLRPNLQPFEPESFLYETYKDIAIAQASLSRDAWGPDAGLRRIKANSSARSVTERYVDLRQSGQRHINKVPLHKVGVRTPGYGFKDRSLANTGGLWVPR